MQSLIILGRQPALGIAELESLYGGAKVTPVVNLAALLDVDPAEVNFSRLGGAVKLAKVLTILDKTDWRSIESYLIKTTPAHAQTLPEGKMHLGLSAYDFHVTPQQLTATGLSIKKAIRKSPTLPKRGVHLIPNNEPALSSAQVYHNKLVGERGWELLLVRHGDQTIIAQTTAVQDIDAYTERDRNRPKRDARVGMLPPKLAQTIINLAGNHVRSDDSNISIVTINGSNRPRLLDPFCGTGVLLQEALLMGYDAYGTDLEQRMIDYSQTNLDWLKDRFNVPEAQFSLEAGDATDHHWQQPIDAVATETYLGKPFTSTPDPAVLAETVGDCNLIITKFLRNIRNQLTAGTRLCIAVPAWQIRPGQFKHLPLVDSLEEMGYNRMRFEHVRDDQLLYYREDQIVARQLLVLIKQ
jgi:tRNA G10  N-methylase Trm11